MESQAVFQAGIHAKMFSIESPPREETAAGENVLRSAQDSLRKFNLNTRDGERGNYTII